MKKILSLFLLACLAFPPAALPQSIGGAYVGHIVPTSPTFVDLTLTGESHVPDGSITAPSYTFTDDASLGLYRISTDLAGWAGDLEVIDPATLASESLNETAFTTHANWDVTGDFLDSGGNAAYTHSTGSGTLTQTAGNMAIGGKLGRWYKFVYTVSGVTAGCTATITTAFAASAQTLTLTAGAQTLYFKSAATQGSFVISVTSTAGGFTIDDVSLKEITGGDVAVHGLLTIPLGTAAAPSLTPIGDGNSGIWAPGADAIAISTAGVEVVRFEVNGIVQVAGGAIGDVDWGGGARVQVMPTTFGLFSAASSTRVADGDRIGSYTFDAVGNTNTYRTRAVIEAILAGSTANKMGADVSFLTAYDNTTDPTEKARLYSTGVWGFKPNDAAATPVVATAALKFFGHNKSVADDASITLPAVTTNGYGIVLVDTDHANRTMFYVTSTGTVTLLNQAGSVVANADTDANLCIGTAATQEPLLIKNRLAAAKVINVMFWYD